MAVPEWIKTHKIQHPSQIAFLTAYSATGRISRACEIATIDRSTHYEWLKTSEDYKAAFAEAKEHLCDLLEDEAFRRAVEGVSNPVFHQGIECGTTQEFSDGLMLRLLAGNIPAKYRDKVTTEVTGKDGEPIKIVVSTGVVQPDPPAATNANPSH